MAGLILTGVLAYLVVASVIGSLVGKGIAFGMKEE